MDTQFTKLMSKAKSGDVYSCLGLMRQYAQGSQNVFKDIVAAKQWGNCAIECLKKNGGEHIIGNKDFVRIKEQADNGDAESAIQLALIYATGTNNMFKDMLIARQWIDKAVKIYSSSGERETVRDIKAERKQVDYDSLPTLELKNLGHKGDKRACLVLAHRYETGTAGVFKDVVEANKWKKKAEASSTTHSVRTGGINGVASSQRQNKEVTVNNEWQKQKCKDGKGKEFEGKVYEEDSQKRVMSKYKDLDSALNVCIKSMRDIGCFNEEFVKLKKGIVSTLDNILVELRQEVESNIKNIRWDKLVIAFFGETNAGKSTIIETFRILFEPNRPKNSDGLIVGDGRPDFTKDYQEYNLSINGHPFVLIDVPGIEGNEKEFKDVIQEALSKAHCVFYVQGHNKKPDVGTAEKIKKYLGDWAIVYSVQNVRGGVTNYDEEDERETLLTTGVLKNEALIRQSFESILGGVYKGNITIQALLAMCAKADFSQKTDYLQSLARNQKKLMKYFGSAEKILGFSQFQTLLNTVDSKSQRFGEEIALANQQKLIALSLKIRKSINNELLNNKEDAESKLTMLKELRRMGNSQLPNLGGKVASVAKSCVRREFNSLGTQLAEELQSDHDKEEKKRFVRNRIQAFPRELGQKLSKETIYQIELVKGALVSQARRIKGVDFSKSLVFDFNMSFKWDMDILEDGLSELDVNLEDVGDVAYSAVAGAAAGAGIGSCVPVVGTAIGAGVGAAIGALSSIGSKMKFGDGGIGSANESIADVLNRSQQSVMSKISQDVSKVRTQANRMRVDLIQQIDREINSVERIQEVIEELNDNIESIINN